MVPVRAHSHEMFDARYQSGNLEYQIMVLRGKYHLLKKIKLSIAIVRGGDYCARFLISGIVSVSRKGCVVQSQISSIEHVIDINYLMASCTCVPGM